MEANNVFADLGYPDAAEHSLKADMVVFIGQLIKARRLTQAEAAKILNASQPDVSNMLRGRFSGFSLERLIGFVSALGNDVTIKVKPTESHKTGRVVLTA